MRPALPDYADKAINEFIRQKVEESSATGVVIGLSGGIDSAVTAKLCCDAIGADKVLCLFLPTKLTPKQDSKDVEELCKRFGMDLEVVPIDVVVEAFAKLLPDASDRRLKGNLMARCRMAVLMHHAKLMDRIVMGTSNKSELLVGYFTKFGDGGADFMPIGDLYKMQVRQLGELIGVPERIIAKVPTAGLWKGQTDEGELGLSYEDLDEILYGFELNLPEEEIAKRTGLDLAKIDRVWRMHRESVHKRKMPLIPKLGVRTVGLDWRE